MCWTNCSKYVSNYTSISSIIRIITIEIRERINLVILLTFHISVRSLLLMHTVPDIVHVIEKPLNKMWTLKEKETTNEE